MARGGVFGPDERVELLEGEIFQFPPPSPPQPVATSISSAAVRQAFGAGHCVRVQQPLSLGQRSDPQPDVAVVLGSHDDYVKRHRSRTVVPPDGAVRPLAKPDAEIPVASLLPKAA